MKPWTIYDMVRKAKMGKSEKFQPSKVMEYFYSKYRPRRTAGVLPHLMLKETVKQYEIPNRLKQKHVTDKKSVESLSPGRSSERVQSCARQESGPFTITESMNLGQEPSHHECNAEKVHKYSEASSMSPGRFFLDDHVFIMCCYWHASYFSVDNPPNQRFHCRNS